MRAVTGQGSIEDRLRALEAFANFPEYIVPVSAVAGDSGATPPVHTLLSASHSDTVVQTVSRGFLIYGNATPAWDGFVAPGATGVLTHDITDASWTTTTTNGAVFRRNNVGVLGFGPVDLDTANTVIGTLDVANGGTNRASLTDRAVVLGRGSASVDFAAPGTAGLALVSTGAAANPAFGAIDLDAASVVSGTLAVANGGTNLASGTSGGVLAYTASGTLTSSGALADNVLVVGGGAGAVPNTLTAGLGTTTQVLHGNASGEPTWSQVAIGADVSGLGTGVATFLGTPSSANLLAAVTDETGSGSGTPLLVFNQSPTIVTPTIASFANANHDHDDAAGGGLLPVYLLLAGRTGTTNNATLSTDADGTLTGSGTTSFDLRLNSDGHTTGGSAPSARGYVNPLQPLHLLPDGYTFDCDSSGFGMSAAANRSLGIIAVGDGTITLSGSNPTFRILTANGTVSLTESNGDSVAMGALFNHALTYSNADGLNLGPTQTLVDAPVFSVNATAGARTQGFHATVIGSPTVTRAAGSNAVTLTSLYGLFSSPVVNSNCTVTNYYGVLMKSITGSGAVTTRWGLYMEDPVGATVTNDYVLGFNAAVGTHNAVMSAAAPATNTVSTAGNVSPVGSNLVIRGWGRVDQNGTVYYIPFFGV